MVIERIDDPRQISAALRYARWRFTPGSPTTAPTCPEPDARRRGMMFAPYLELTRFRGHFPPCGEGVPYGQATSSGIPSGVPA